MKPPTYNVHAVEAGEKPDGNPIAFVTLCCTPEEARLAGALLYRDVTLVPVEEAEIEPPAMPGTATFDLDDPEDLPRFLGRLDTKASGVLMSSDAWARAYGQPPPSTLRDIVERVADDFLVLRGFGPTYLRRLREALVEAGLPDLEA